MSDDKYAFVDSWRPSRVRVITKGELFWTEVDILDMSDLPTALAIAGGLGLFEIKVNHYKAGLAEHAKKVLGGDSIAKAPYLIIAAHGAEKDGDLVIGQELAGEIAATQDFSGAMSPADLEKFVDVKDKVVINTACVGGDQTLADVFVRKGGAKAYIADTDAPFGYTSFLFPVLFFYFVTNYPDITIKQAFERAQAADPTEFKTWQLFE